MSGCIYHDAESVSICPSCDFGVCQQCMDEGSEGVCSTCSEERDNRRQNSALQREYTVEEQVPRCNYCRVAADADAPHDEQGYCEACRTLARCCVHDELIAVGHCKTCRKEYCRKCLGFTDVCQTCTAQNKTKPLKPPPATAAKPSKAKKPASAGAKGPAKSPGKSTAKNTAPLAESSSKQKAPTRGKLAMEAKLNARAAKRGPGQIVIFGIIGAIACIWFLGSLVVNASSPESQSKLLQAQMKTVQKAVLHYFDKNKRLPLEPREIYQSLGELKVKDATKITILLYADRKPGSVLYRVNPPNNSFMIQGTNSKGEILAVDGQALVLDQYTPSD